MSGRALIVDDSVVRCIELGATDYLPKPFNAAVLRARVSASLAGKRLRDLEQVNVPLLIAREGSTIRISPRSGGADG